MSTTPGPDVQSLEGYYAGAVTRLSAALIDGALSVAVFAGSVALIEWLFALLFDTDLTVNHGSLWWTLPLLVWEFVYYWYCFSLSGKTPACALLGIRVVRDTGAPIDARHAAIRVITFPLSFLFFGIGFVGILFGRRRRAWHDMFGRSGVVYDWDARAARLRFLAHRKPAGN